MGKPPEGQRAKLHRFGERWGTHHKYTDHRPQGKAATQDGPKVRQHRKVWASSLDPAHPADLSAKCRGTQRTPRGPKMAPRCPKMAPRMAQRSPNTAGSGHPLWTLRSQQTFRRSAEALREPQDGPRWPQDAPRWPQDAPKTVKTYVKPLKN